MIFIWQGAEFVGIIIPIIFMLGGQYGLDSFFGDGYSRSHGWAMPLFIFLSAIAVWLVGINLDKFPARESIDPRTQQKVLIKERHTVFWRPLKYFAMLLVVWAVFLLFKFGNA